MRTVKWNAFLSGLCGFAVALGVVTASAVRADVTTEKGASILVFPKVLANGTFDTVIQIANTSNQMRFLKCFYVDAQAFSSFTGLPCSVPSATCVPQWQETDFTIALTRQQPTHWLVSKGRPVDPFDNFVDANGTGFDPGAVPPEGCDVKVDPTCSSPFLGELKCVQVADSGEPITGNSFKGEATLEVVHDSPGGDINSPGASKGDVSKYNAIGILGHDVNPPANALLLDGQNYDACPAKLVLNHFASGSTDPVVDAATERGAFAGFDSSNSTELTLVPCSEDFENQIATRVTVNFLIYNEFETKFSSSTTVNCYLSTELTNIDSRTNPKRSIFAIGSLLTTVAHTEIIPVPNQDGSEGAVIGVVERAVTSRLGGASGTTRAAYDLHTEGDLILDPPDQITLPLDQF